jgi:hypothetical protein
VAATTQAECAAKTPACQRGICPIETVSSTRIGHPEPLFGSRFSRVQDLAHVFRWTQPPTRLVVKHSMSKTTYAASGPTIIAQAPCRADLAGGTIDLWPLYLFHPGALTVNFAVNILTTCRITPLKGKRIHLRSVDTRREEEFSSFDALRATSRFRLPLGARLLQFFAPKEGLLMETDSESPAGAGISGSSALMIASTAALARFTDRNLTLEQMRVIAQNVEAQIIQVPTGCQDYYPCALWRSQCDSSRCRRHPPRSGDGRSGRDRVALCFGLHGRPAEVGHQ